MSNSVGAMSFPLPQPALYGQPADPALAVLGQALPPILRSYLSNAFASTQTSFDFVAGVYYFDPKAVYDGANINVDDSSLPALYLFSRRAGSTQLTDAHHELEREISIFWVPPSRQRQDNSLVDAMFGPFAAAIATIVQNERDIAWIADDDAGTDADPVINARKIAAQVAGSNIPDHCGFSRWYQSSHDATGRDHFTLTSPLGLLRYDGVLAKITACEMLTNDQAAFGAVPTSLQQSFATGDATPFPTGGFFKPPAT